MIGPGQAPTRAAVLALREERVVVGEAYDFLDEKRLLLAAEILRQLELYQRLMDELQAVALQAGQRLAEALRQHGLHGLSVYPAARLDRLAVFTSSRNFMGVTLIEGDLRLTSAETTPASPTAYPSPQAAQCREVFLEMLKRSAVLAAISGNLHRLIAEYRITERRARALENIILPEIEQSLRDMSSHLEELDMEDAIRVRLQASS
jgi:V/A-type H+-transporting ATPase subunit D